MSALFDACFEDLILIEGGYSDDPTDRGGPTRYGITEAVARANGYLGPMAELDQSLARMIYRKAYWDALRLDDVGMSSPGVAAEMFDTSVNMGAGIAAKFLQTALNALNRDGADYPDLAVDGRIGPVTLAALRAYIIKRGRAEGGQVLRRALDCQQGARYLAIAAADHSQEKYVYGWLRARTG